MGRSSASQVFAAALVLAAGAHPMVAQAATAQDSFGLTLVIAPPCPLSEQGNRADGLAATRAQALNIAATELGLPAKELLIAHDRFDTGWWIVSLSGQGGPEAVMRVEKCTGAIERL